MPLCRWVSNAMVFGMIDDRPNGVETPPVVDAFYCVRIVDRNCISFNLNELLV